jgi:2'-5' RNA ligase
VAEGGTLRTFWAVEIGERARRAAAALAAQLREDAGGDAVRWVAPEAYHVTLRFVGATPCDRVGPMAEAVRRESAGIAPFLVRLGTPGAFPHPRRPRVLVIALEEEPAGALERLAAAAERGLVATGFAPEVRRFHAHLTLGRVRAGRRPPRLADAGCDAAPFAVDSLVLFRSEPGAAPASGGSRYTPLERLPLGGVPSP